MTHTIQNVWSRVVVAILLSIVTSQSIAQSSEETEVANNETVIREFIEAWSRLDPDELLNYFVEDGTYYNMPTSPVTGHENLRQFVAGFIQSWETTDWEILNLLADGDIVMVERIDHTVVAGSPVELPCFGIFEMENGKIKVWRDYFNLPTYTDALTAAAAAAN
jgi:limonene-1,2-epoxide hydrolase